MIQPLATPLTQAKREGFAELVSDRWCLFGIVCVVLLTYSVCLTSTIAHSDDYMFVWDMLGNRDALMQTVTPMGRAVAGLILTVGFLPVDSIERLWIPRLLSMCGIAVLLGMLFTTLRRFGYSRCFAFTFAALAACLPPFTLYAAWATACSMVYAAIAAVGAFWCAERAWTAATSARRVLQSLLAVAFAILALHIYQPTAMFYPVAMLLLVLSPAAFSRERWLRLGFHVLVLLMSLGLGTFVYFLYATSQRGSFDLHLRAKWQWFLAEPLAGSLDLVLFPHEAGLNAWSLGIAGKILLALIGCGVYLALAGSRESRLARIAAACVLLPLTYLPNLAIEESWASYRTRGALAAAVLFLACRAVSGLAGRLQLRPDLSRVLRPVALVAVLGAGVAVAQHHVVEYFVVPCQFEWRLVRREMDRVAAAHPEPVEEVFFLLPNIKLPLPSTWEYDEFGHLSIGRDWVPKPICGLALREVAPQRLASFRDASFTMVPFEQDAPTSRPGRWIVNVRFINGFSDALYVETSDAQSRREDLRDFSNDDEPTAGAN